MEFNTTIPNTNFLTSAKSFYYGDDFKSWASLPMNYAIDIALEQFISQTLKLPLDRIIYASLDYCFRERTRTNDGNLNIPFFTYYQTSYDDCDRPWFNNFANMRYLLDITNNHYYTKVGSKMKIYPIRVNYEGAVFFSQHKDAEYAMNQLMFANSNETIIYPILETNNGQQIKNLAVLSFDLDFNPDYGESDWLEQNRIWSIGVNMYCDTFFIGAIDGSIGLCKKVCLDFISAKNYADFVTESQNEDKGLNHIVTYFEQDESSDESEDSSDDSTE